MNSLHDSVDVAKRLYGLLLALATTVALTACGGGGGGGTPADTTAPTVVTTSPVADATGVALNAVVTVSFSEAVDAASITASTFSLSGATGVSGKLSVSADGLSAELTPDMALAPNTVHTATLTTGVKDVAGNALASDVSWGFTTGAAPDTVAPTISSVTPAADSTGNPASSAISATFSEPINCASATTSNVQLFEGSTPVSIQVQCSGATLTLVATQGTPTNTTLTATIGASVTDLTGNALASDQTWSFGVAPWTRLLGSANDENPAAVATDAAGNVFIAGVASGDLDGHVNAGRADIFIAKYDMNGAKLWTRMLGTAADDAPTSIATDASGNVVVAGYTAGDLEGIANAGGLDIFVSKYDTNGNQLWMRVLGTAMDDSVNGVATDEGGNVFVAGYTSGALGGLANAGGQDAFLLKYDATGTQLWSRQFGSANEDFALSVATDAAGNVVVVGGTTGMLAGGAWGGGVDLFVRKYDANGVELWTDQRGEAGSEYPSAVATDAAGNVVVVGYTSGGFDGQGHAGGYDILVVKYTAMGTWLWTRLLGTANEDMALGVAIDATGAAYVVGASAGGLGGQAGAGGMDAFVTKYAENGIKRWTSQFGGTGDDWAFGVATGATGHVVVAGQTTDSLDGQTNAGGDDVFIMKYQNDGTKR